MVPQKVVLFLTLEVVPKLTLERPKSGTKTNSPEYIYIYAYAVKLLSGPSLGFLEVIIWSKLGFWKLLSGPSWVFGSYYLVQVCVFSL